MIASSSYAAAATAAAILEANFRFRLYEQLMLLMMLLRTLLLVQCAVIVLHTTAIYYVNIVIIESIPFIHSFVGATITIAIAVVDIIAAAAGITIATGYFIFQAQATVGATAVQWCRQRRGRAVDAVDLDVAFRRCNAITMRWLLALHIGLMQQCKLATAVAFQFAARILKAAIEESATLATRQTLCMCVYACVCMYVCVFGCA